ncbi:hypothetical protein ABKN59_007295 [Abortiporus biennis]
MPKVDHTLLGCRIRRNGLICSSRGLTPSDVKKGTTTHCLLSGTKATGSFNEETAGHRFLPSPLPPPHSPENIQALRARTHRIAFVAMPDHTTPRNTLWSR